jgi:DNA-binding NarL/FixJ family response regulator
MRIWVQSPYYIFAEALLHLLTELGFQASISREEETELALWDLSSSQPPYPMAPSLPTLAIISGQETNAVTLLHNHYRGYLTPADSSETLKKALEAVRRGEIWAERSTLTKVIDSFATPTLTLKEKEVFNLLTKGMSNRAISKALNITEGTVKMHVSHLFSKLGVKSRTELIAQHFER